MSASRGGGPGRGCMMWCLAMLQLELLVDKLRMPFSKSLSVSSLQCHQERGMCVAW